MLNVLEATSLRGTWSISPSNRRLPLPTTIGCTSRRSSSSRLSRSSDRTSVGAAGDRDVLAGLLLRPGQLPARSPLISVEFAIDRVRVVETTTFGVLFMWPAVGTSLGCCGQ